jgi:hypothetical protein
LWAGASAIAGALALCHAVANGFAAAKLDFFTVAAREQGAVFFHLNDQAGVGQANPVAHRGAKNLCVRTSSNRGHLETFKNVSYPRLLDKR